MMDFPYPGGPLIDKYAQAGNPKSFSFPHTAIPGLDFSFSGIKTAFLYFLRDNKKTEPRFVELNKNDICASLQVHLVNMVMEKLKLAVEQTGINCVAIAGGVAANSELRKSLQNQAGQSGWNVFIPKFEYCTDNAAMIAIAAHYKFVAKRFASLNVAPLANLAIGE
jgi:N6-L-threonylcarbamoyladenine synthase